ncbi:MAG: type II toxin-antitoxin system prevent-host-death family antitoxin [Betaproteobacteria bacterium]|nr:type II toxin-antitoxin system prevent-host-death family antitoxin [Betaproteobacteria bacterium]
MHVSIRELKAHLSRYLAQARQGTALEITSHRRVVARVTGVPESGTPALGELIARGAAQWDGNKPQGAHIVLSKGGTPVSRIVLEDRG